MQPTPERYKEIQQSLADKGYFRGPVDGTWGPDSALAMKRFQTEQNLDADGKIGALSLVALGLGPRRGAAKAAGDDPGKPPGPAAETPAAGTPSAGGGLTSAPTSEGAAPAPDTPVQPQQ